MQTLAKYIHHTLTGIAFSNDALHRQFGHSLDFLNNTATNQEQVSTDNKHICIHNVTEIERSTSNKQIKSVKLSERIASGAFVCSFVLCMCE